MGHLHWDIPSRWTEIKAGLVRSSVQGGSSEGLAGVGIDTWGVDFGLLDGNGKMLGNPFHYRDARTAGILDRLADRIELPEIYRLTGVQPSEITTLSQLFSMVVAADPNRDSARTLLPMPALFSHKLSGRPVAEYTHATTSQCVAAGEMRWCRELLEQPGIAESIFPPIVAPAQSSARCSPT
jgi:rhamnulokinase